MVEFTLKTAVDNIYLSNCSIHFAYNRCNHIQFGFEGNDLSD
jgi:hypothetical protein